MSNQLYQPGAESHPAKQAELGSEAKLLLSKRLTWLLEAVILLAVVSYFVRVVGNPPGYYIDESSISYNAETISETGRDEFGTAWPLYFRAFNDYKNPVYVYLLAAIYRITGPSILAARLFSATLGVLAAMVSGLLGWRLTKKREVALLVMLLALLTPWLFEISRVVLEVSLYPLVLGAFLLAAHSYSTHARWSWTDAVCLASTLALITYTYSIGRLLGPLLALGLILFASRGRRGGVMLTWGLYGLGLVPILLFNQHNPGALTGRFHIVTYLERGSSYGDIVWTFVKHFVGNLNPWKLFVTGDPNPEQIAHIYGAPLLLGATGILIVVGLWLVVRHHLHDAWWRFIIYCLVMSVVPASLTKEYVHMLRLTPLVVFLIVLTIPALEWLIAGGKKQRLALAVLLGLMIFQAVIFQWQFQTGARSAKRLRQFDNGYPEKIFARAMSMTDRPIYLADALAIPGYIQAYWNATLRRIPLSTFVRLAPDESPLDGTLVISTEENCPRCQILGTSEFYTLYRAAGPSPKREALPTEGFRAALKVISSPNVFLAGQQAKLRVLVRNDSNSVWLTRERSGGKLQVSLGNHWLDRQGNVISNDDGRAALLNDLGPGEQVELNLTVNTPATPGDYILELDMLQEGVSWFALKNSPTVRLQVTVEKRRWN